MLDLQMTELRPNAIGAAIQPVVGDQSHADAMFDRDHDEIGQLPPLAEQMLRQGYQVGVVLDH